MPGTSLVERWAGLPEGQILLPSPDQVSAFLQATLEPAADPAREMRDSLGRFVNLAGVEERQLSGVVQDALSFLRRLFRP